MTYKFSLKLKPHEKKHLMSVLLNIGFAALVLSAIIIIILMTIDSAFVFGEKHISLLQDGENGLIFNITLVAISIIILVTLPALLEGIFDIASNKESKQIFKIFSSVLTIGTMYLIPVALFQYKSGVGINLFGWEITDLHGFFATKFFLSFIYALYLLSIMYCFNFIKGHHDRKKLLRVGYIIITFNLIGLFIADTWTEHADILYIAIIVTFGAYFLLLLIKSDIKISISNFSITTKGLILLLLSDLLIIGYFDRYDFENLLLTGDISKVFSIANTNGDSAFATFEIVLFINILIILGVVYFKESLEIRNTVK